MIALIIIRPGKMSRWIGTRENSLIRKAFAVILN